MEKKNKDTILLDNKDNFDGVEECTNNILINKYSLEDIYRLCDSDEIIIGLNILENIPKYIDKKYLSKQLSNIYLNYTYSDIIDTFLTITLI